MQSEARLLKIVPVATPFTHELTIVSIEFYESEIVLLRWILNPEDKQARRVEFSLIDDRGTQYVFGGASSRQWGDTFGNPGVVHGEALFRANAEGAPRVLTISTGGDSLDVEV